MNLFNLLNQGWKYFYETMINFLNAYPVLGPIVLLITLAVMTYSIILSTKISKTNKQKEWSEIFDLRYKYENPSPVVKTIEAIILPILSLPIYLFEKIMIGLIKITFYLITVIMIQVMKIRFK